MEPSSTTTDPSDPRPRRLHKPSARLTDPANVGDQEVEQHKAVAQAAKEAAAPDVDKAPSTTTSTPPPKAADPKLSDGQESFEVQSDGGDKVPLNNGTSFLLALVL